MSDKYNHYPAIKECAQYVKQQGVCSYNGMKNGNWIYVPNAGILTADNLRPYIHTFIRDNPKHTPSTAHLLRNYLFVHDLLSVVSGERFKPSEYHQQISPVIHVKGSPLFYVNLYKRLELDYNKHDPFGNNAVYENSPLEFLLKRMFPVDDERHYVLQWFAHLMQKPNEKPSVSQYWISNHGTGKGFFYKHVIRPLLSEQCTQVDAFSDLTEKHSTILERNLLVMIDDPCPQRNVDVYERMKSMFTEETTYINPKGQVGYSCDTYTRFWICTNTLNLLKIPDTDRRLFIPTYIDHAVSLTETQKRVQAAREWIENGGLHAFYDYLLSYDISDFDPKECPAPSLEKKKAVNAVRSDLELRLIEYSDYLEKHNISCISASYARKYIKRLDEDYKFSMEDIKQGLITLGYEAKQCNATTWRKYGGVCAKQDMFVQRNHSGGWQAITKDANAAYDLEAEELVSII